MKDSQHTPDFDGETPNGADSDDPSSDVFADVIARLSGRRESFSRYRVHGEVARGGMGKILRVRDEDLHRDLAMKVILPRNDSYSATGSSAVEPRMLGRFLEEAQVTGQLDHPGVVPVHEMGLDADGNVYFTMRFVAGRNLEKIFELVAAEQEGWTRTRAVSAMLKVCEAVAYAHDKGVIHRDLKPANIMVGKFGEVYVMDWGLARVMGRPERRDVRLRAKDSPSTAVHSNLLSARLLGTDSALVTMDGDIVGTPAYMSPEQARGEINAIGTATDVYAIGAILYHLLAGHPPFVVPGDPSDPIEVWRRVREGPPEPIRTRAPDAHPELAAICAKAMAREVKDRYVGVLSLAEDLHAYLEGRVVGAYEAGAWAEVRKWFKRNKAIALTVFIATLVLIVGSTTTAIVLSQKNSELVAANEKSRSSEERALANADLARANETRANQNAAIAEDRAAKILRLSDNKRLSELEKTAATLWPALPPNISKYEQWLTEARELAARLSEHENTLKELRRSALPSATPEGPSRFERAEDRWQHDNQEELVRNLTAFVEPAKGRVADVERRLAFARTIEERSVTGKDASASWAAAVRSIADRTVCPAYAGLSIRPQLGLLPIGRDPRSGLWEFAHLQSGAPAVRDAGTGKLVLTEDTGIVFVLLPGGAFKMGAQSAEITEANYDPRAGNMESPVHTVTLSPFFMSKYELTQGQWLRVTGANPSVYGPLNPVDGRPNDLTHPVEQVSWIDCNEVLTELDLVLPTESQWEYAARSGTSTPWYTGNDKESLEGAANIADQAAARAGATWPGIGDWPDLDDGFVAHAPVGSFKASPFGLHDMHGNVWEWCRDWFGSYGSAVRDGDGERTPAVKLYRANRGGSFYHAAPLARSSSRNNSPPDTRTNHLGVRPSRMLSK